MVKNQKGVDVHAKKDNKYYWRCENVTICKDGNDTAYSLIGKSRAEVKAQQEKECEYKNTVQTIIHWSFVTGESSDEDNYLCGHCKASDACPQGYEPETTPMTSPECYDKCGEGNSEFSGHYTVLADGTEVKCCKFGLKNTHCYCNEEATAIYDRDKPKNTGCNGFVWDDKESTEAKRLYGDTWEEISTGCQCIKRPCAEGDIITDENKPNGPNAQGYYTVKRDGVCYAKKFTGWNGDTACYKDMEMNEENGFGCEGDLEFDTENCECAPQKCPEGYSTNYQSVADCTKNNHPQGWNFSSNGKSGDLLCGKCEAKTCTTTTGYDYYCQPEPKHEEPDPSKGEEDTTDDKWVNDEVPTGDDIVYNIKCVVQCQDGYPRSTTEECACEHTTPICEVGDGWWRSRCTEDSQCHTSSEFPLICGQRDEYGCGYCIECETYAEHCVWNERAISNQHCNRSEGWCEIATHIFEPYEHYEFIGRKVTFTELKEDYDSKVGCTYEGECMSLECTDTCAEHNLEEENCEPICEDDNLITCKPDAEVCKKQCYKKVTTTCENGCADGACNICTDTCKAHDWEEECTSGCDGDDLITCTPQTDDCGNACFEKVTTTCENGCADGVCKEDKVKTYSIYAYNYNQTDSKGKIMVVNARVKVNGTVYSSGTSATIKTGDNVELMFDFNSSANVAGVTVPHWLVGSGEDETTEADYISRQMDWLDNNYESINNTFTVTESLMDRYNIAEGDTLEVFPWIHIDAGTFEPCCTFESYTKRCSITCNNQNDPDDEYCGQIYPQKLEQIEALGFAKIAQSPHSWIGTLTETNDTMMCGYATIRGMALSLDRWPNTESCEHVTGQYKGTSSAYVDVHSDIRNMQVKCYWYNNTRNVYVDNINIQFSQMEYVSPVNNAERKGALTSEIDNWYNGTSSNY
ncbi:MAG: hypothetical protein IJ218_01135 [Alphaproteobacteria bacterium]|nr:hypothetical protein [Alphaproteobacteria bacterium]